MDFSRDRAQQHLVELNIFIIFLLCLLMEGAVVLMARQSSGPCVFCMYLGSGTCFKGDECTSAHAWEELHPDTPVVGLARGDFVLNSDGYVAEIRCEGPGAWHPLDPSWVPLPVLRGRLNILESTVFWGRALLGSTVDNNSASV